MTTPDYYWNKDLGVGYLNVKMTLRNSNDLLGMNEQIVLDTMEVILEERKVKLITGVEVLDINQDLEEIKKDFLQYDNGEEVFTHLKEMFRIEKSNG